MKWIKVCITDEDMKNISSLEGIENASDGGFFIETSYCDFIQFTNQPERSKREDSIPEWGANAPLNYHEWVRRCGALNSRETD